MAANIICNDIAPPPLPLAGFGTLTGGGCYIAEGGVGTEVAYLVAFDPDGILRSSEGVNGPWLFSGVTSDFEISSAGPPADGMTSGVYYSMAGGIALRWSYTLSGSSGGRFLGPLLKIRRVSDGVIVATIDLETVQLGVNTECV